MKIKNLARVLSILAGITIFGVLASLFIGYLIGSVDTIKPLNQGWTMLDSAGRIREQVQLPAHKVRFKANGYTELTQMLPKEFKDAQMLCINSSLDRVCVYLDEQLIYEEPITHDFWIGQAPVFMKRLVKLPKDSDGQKLLLRFKNPSVNLYGDTASVTYGPTQDMIGYIMYSARGYTTIALINILIGLEILFVFIIWGKILRKRSIGYLSIFMILFGFWEYNNESGIFSTFANNIFSSYNFCMAILFLTPIPFFLHVYEEFEEQDKKGFRFVIMGLILNAVFGSIVLILGPIYQLNLKIIERSTIVWGSIAVAFMIYYNFMSIRRLCKMGWGFRDIMNPRRAGEMVLCGLIVIGIVFHVLRMFAWTGIAVCGGATMYTSLICYLKIKELIQEAKDAKAAQIEWEESRNELLLGQIQPHFIYNTLTSIRVLIRKSPQQAYALTRDFSTYLKYNLNTLEDHDIISFEAEIENVKTYLSIEQVRFADKFQVVYEIQAHNFMIPYLTIQPLVENAVKHGDFEVGGGGTIWIRSIDKEDFYLIQVEDNGRGFDTGKTEEKKSNSIGIKNIKSRLRYILGTDLKIQSIVGKGTLAEIEIPKNK